MWCTMYCRVGMYATVPTYTMLVAAKMPSVGPSSRPSDGDVDHQVGDQDLTSYEGYLTWYYIMYTR